LGAYKKGQDMPQNKQKRDAKLGGETQLQGWPGYRTRDNRSGLDPLDTQPEAAHMEGTFFHNLFTLRLRTRNPFYLIEKRLQLILLLLARCRLSSNVFVCVKSV
jgi:hypothetical protein